MICPTCGYDRNRPEDGTCNLCGEVLRSQAPATFVLQSATFQPFVLPTTRPFTVGREPSNDLTLPSVTISRRHAQITHQDGQYVLEDLGSSNGTFVNEKRIEKVVLVDGDQIDFGPFNFSFRKSEGDQSDDTPEQTQMISLSALGMHSVNLAGKLDNVDLVEILQFLEFNRKTGQLIIHGRKNEGVVFVSKGNVVNARFGKLEGEEAVFQMVLTTEGSFEFQDSLPMVETQIFSRTSELILEIHRRIDEAEHRG